MSLRGIRGAVTAAENTRDGILDAATQLLREIVHANALAVEDVASILFTTTPDLNAEFPAAAARALGWQHVPLLCMQEIDVPGRLPGCIRVLVLANSDLPQAAVKHVYLGDAAALRPDFKVGDR